MSENRPTEPVVVIPAEREASADTPLHGELQAMRLQVLADEWKRVAIVLGQALAKSWEGAK